jgi:hypothetical protein
VGNTFIPQRRFEDEDQTAWRQVSTREHPFRQLCDQIGAGNKPTKAKIDRVLAGIDDAAVRAEVRATLVELIDTCQELVRAGDQGPARRLAVDCAFDLSAKVGPYHPPEIDEDLSPSELAGRIRR